MKPAAIPSASHPKTNQVLFETIRPLIKEGVKILDFGAGRGHMSQKIGEEARRRRLQPKDCIHPCEIVPEEFQYDQVQCRRIDVDSLIPHPDEHFDVVYAIEVLEHTLRPYDFFKEAARALKPGGLILVSVPNLMHVLSRFGLLLSGFGALYPPPSKLPANAGRICGHVMPLTYPYFHYGLAKQGFEDIAFLPDKRKKACLFWACLLRPLFKLASHSYQKSLKKYDPNVWNENKHLVPAMNSLDMLTSRSLIVQARKPTR